MLDPHGALIYTMVIVTGAETSIGATEQAIMGDIIGHLPVFRGFDRTKLTQHLNDCAELLSADDGLDKTLDAIKAALPDHLRETAYAIGCSGFWRRARHIPSPLPHCGRGWLAKRDG